jgi:mannosyltransferase
MSQILLVCAAMAVGLVLRVFRLGRDSVWRDEANTWQLARSSWATIARDHQNHQPPLYYFFTKAFVTVFGDSEKALRLPAALIGTLCIPVIGLLAETVAGPTALVPASWTAAVVPGLVFYSRQARAYTLFAALAALALLALAPVAAPAAAFHRAPGCLGAALVALLYTHPYGLLAWGAIGLYVGGGAALGVGEARPLLVEWAVAGALFVPYARVLGRQVQTAFEEFWIQRLGVAGIAKVPGELLVGPRAPKLLLYAASLFAVAAVAALPPGWAIAAAVLAVACWLAPAASAYLFRPLFVPRYAIALQPLLVVAVSAIACRVPFAVAALVAGLLVETIRMLRAGTEKEDWRWASAHLVAARERGAAAVVVNKTWDDPLESDAFAYYARSEPLRRRALREPDGTTRVELPEGHVAVLLLPLGRLRDAVVRAKGNRTIVDERRFRGVLFLELR